MQGKEVTYTTQYQVLLMFINILKDIKNPVLVDPICATLICQSLLTGRKSSIYFQHLLNENENFSLKGGRLITSSVLLLNFYWNRLQCT